MTTVLTANACAALNNDTNYHILVEEPILRVEEVEYQQPSVLFDFTKKATAKLSDGTGTAYVLLPEDYTIYGTRAGFDGRTLSSGDVIRIKRMVRLPPGENR